MWQHKVWIPWFAARFVFNCQKQPNVSSPCCHLIILLPFIWCWWFLWIVHWSKWLQCFMWWAHSVSFTRQVDPSTKLLITISVMIKCDASILSLAKHIQNWHATKVNFKNKNTTNNCTKYYECAMTLIFVRTRCFMFQVLKGLGWTNCWSINEETKDSQLLIA